jgi:hypothetical protein
MPLSNIKIQRLGPGILDESLWILPAADLERYTDQAAVP